MLQAIMATILHFEESCLKTSGFLDAFVEPLEEKKHNTFGKEN